MKSFFPIVKFALPILILCSTTKFLYANSVPASTARNVAVNAFSYYSSSSADATIKELIPIKTNDTTLIYICNFKNGFVIASADDVARPILGFSDEHSFDVNDMAPAVELVLNNYKKAILYAKRTKVTASLEIQNEWQSFINNTLDRSFYTPSSYLIQTTWNQSGGYHNSSPVRYNHFCPSHYDQNGDSCKTVVGCGAVALAQILHYWACDVYPHGTVYNNNENVSLNLSDQSYEWYIMLPKNADIYNAQLLADCAMAINSDFGCELTSSNPATIRSKLVNNYGFEQSVYLIKSIYSDNVWTDTLKYNLNNRYPIIYVGFDTIHGGHAWVIDGYNNYNYFHCNFGWGGRHDAWFLLTSIIPDGYNFNYNQSALLNIYPTTYNNTEFIDTTIPTGTYSGHKIIIENSSVNSNSTVVMDSECSTEIFGPFSVPVGSTLNVR